MSVDAAVEIVRRGQRFLVTCHVMPDPDAVGSMLGLVHILRSLGKEVVVYNRDPIPDSVSFLPGADEVVPTLPQGVKFDATFITDTAARSLLPTHFPSREITGPIVIVDHHLAHDDFGDVIVRDVNACATAVVVMQLSAALGVKQLPKNAAAPLYAAIIADTGGFRYPNTTAETLRQAASLVDLGVDPANVAFHVFESWPMPRMRLLGCAIDVLETEHNGRIAVQCIPLAMIQNLGATQQMIEGMVEYGRRLRGVEIAAMLWERPARSDETGTGQLLTRISLRSSGPADVSRVAVALGGGGHRAAAGATVRLDMQTARERVVAGAARELGITA